MCLWNNSSTSLQHISHYTPTPAVSRLCDGRGRKQANCAADQTSQPMETCVHTSQTILDSARTRRVHISHKGMFVKINRRIFGVEGHPYIHWYTQRDLVNLLAETKSTRKCVECHKDRQRAPEIEWYHCWDHFVYYLCTRGFLTARQEPPDSHQRQAECSGYEKINAYNKERAIEDQLPRAWEKLTALPIPESGWHGGAQSPNKVKQKATHQAV